MYLNMIIAAAGLSLANVVRAEHMQLNFYSDNACTKYIGEIDGGWAWKINNDNKEGGINYRYGTSLNIAACSHKWCYCRFYKEPNKGGDAEDYWSLVYGMEKDGNCIRNAQQFQSYQCFYYS